MKDNIYMAITADQYELPLCAFDTLKELSVYVGKPSKQVSYYIVRGCRDLRLNCRYIKVNIPM